jgi:hypothetical protein
MTDATRAGNRTRRMPAIWRSLDFTRVNTLVPMLAFATLHAQ